MGFKKKLKKTYKTLLKLTKKSYDRLQRAKHYRDIQKKYPVYGNDDISIDFNAYDSVREKYIPLAVGYEDKKSEYTINDFYFNKEIEEKTVLVLGLGHHVRGNLRYVLDELNHSDQFEGFKVYVRVWADTSEAVRACIEKNGWCRTKICKGRRQYDRLLESVQYLLTETFFPESWVKKPGQIYINIWHGTPLKKLGLAKNARNAHRNGPSQKNFMNADYLLYPNRYTRNHMLESYKVSELMQGKVLMLGYPRTGGMLYASEHFSEDIRKTLAPEGQKIYAYMPTFRDYLSEQECVEKSRGFLDYLEENLRDDQVLYVNLHHKLNDFIDYSVYKRVRKFPSDIDSYQLLAASDALISDYSSVFFDYLALRKQIILFIDDYKAYRKKRGMYMNLLKLPFDKAESKEEVLAALNRGKTYEDKKVFERFCSNDSTENAGVLCRLFCGRQDTLNLETIPHHDGMKVYCYSEAMQAGEETELLCRFIQEHDQKEGMLYLGCDSNRTDENRDYAYPAFFGVPVLGTENNPYLTSLGEYLKRMYREGQLSFDKAMEYLQYDYALLSRRILAGAQFDQIVIYDSFNPENIIALTEAETPKLLFLQEHMIETEDPFLRDAIFYAAEHSRNVCVSTERMKEPAKVFLGDHWKNEIFVVDSPEKMEAVIFTRNKESKW